MNKSNEKKSLKRVRALIADDDPTARQLIRARLSKLACDCEEAKDGMEAWHAIMSNSFDLAIVDLSMPNIDGYELIRCARDHPRTKHMPMVVVTSHNDKESIEDAMSAGATSFLTKPINWTTFLAHIEYLLKLSSEANDARKKVRRSEAAARAKDAVLGNVLAESSESAHSILAAANALLQSSTGQESSEQVSEALRQVAHAAQSLQNVVDKANHVVEVIPETVTIEDDLVVVSSVLEDLRQQMSTTAAAHDVDLVFLKATENPTLRCDKGAVVEALTQLIINSVTNSRAGQAITVSYQICPDGTLAFEVVDDGAGMSPDQLGKVLSPLEFTDATPGIATGNIGMGLPIAKAIAEAHGGALKLRSMKSQGTTAVLKIPAERVIVAEADAA